MIGRSPRAAPARRIGGMRAFRHRNYRLFFAGQAISLVGTWMQQVAQAWLVLELTERPALARRRGRRPVPPGRWSSGCSPASLADALPKRQTLIGDPGRR